MSRPNRFPEVPSGYPFPALEREVLELWRRRDVFAKTLTQPAPAGEFVMYEGPPTANNVPHVGHVVTRAVKDLVPRFRTMQGYRVPRKAGWDTHGLPVEIEVEKRLGFSGKQEIEEYGIAEFNRACLDSVHTYERQWRAMTERVGYWTDLDDAYYTFSNRYIESVWWSLAELARQDLLAEGYKIQPYCARCGTTLSSHEVAQNYKDADDPSVWVLFPVREGQRVARLAAAAGEGEGEAEAGEGEGWRVPASAALVAWTTTPWTLLAHVGLAVQPEMTYRAVERPDRPGELLIFGEGLDTPVPLVVDEGGERRRLDLRELPALARFRGADLAGLAYDRPYPTGEPDQPPGPPAFEPPPSDADGWRVFAADYVTAAEGTGIVHTAPPFGEDDYQSGRRFSLPFFLTIDGEGRVASKPGIEAFAGRGFKEADPEIVRDLQQRGRMLHADRVRHSYPFCWRCDRPLLYYATTSWFVRTTERKAELVAANREIDWHPAHVGEGRFGNWLDNVVDWALSRRRYWGTPLPVWRCGSCQAPPRVIGSYAELFAAAGIEPPDDPYDRERFDPHRPFIDEVTWPCPGCGEGTMRRVEEVIDAWYDSGAMPFAQHHYPFTEREAFAGRFPADFISEAVDQTRGWFYTLHVLGTLLFGSPAFRHCVVLGHVADETGRKMSKRLGNVVEPMEVLEQTGADALRWYFYINNPEVNSRFSARLVREAAGSCLLPLWNALSFFTIYANLDGWRPPAGGAGDGEGDGEFDRRPALDRWILLRLGRLVGDTTAHLEGYRIAEAARGIEGFLDELTNWYIRRSRDRFWGADGEADDGKPSAYRALYEVLTTLARLVAPFTPFVAEVLYRHLVESQRPGAADSVHLERWPEPAAHRRDERLEEGMAAVQRIVRLGHAARNTHGLKTRQPLAAVTLVSADPELPARVEPHADLLRDELNVHAIRWAADRAAYVHHEVRPVFPKTGPRFGKRMREVQAALAAADGDRLAAELEADGRVTIELADGPVELAADEVEVRLVERAGTATQGDRELLVALDTELTPELVAEGLAREVVHRIQSRRKEADLDYADRIRVHFRAGAELAAAITAHHDWIAGETLAVELAAADDDGAGLDSAPVEGHEFALGVERVEPARHDRPKG